MLTLDYTPHSKFLWLTLFFPAECFYPLFLWLTLFQNWKWKDINRGDLNELTLFGPHWEIYLLTPFLKRKKKRHLLLYHKCKRFLWLTFPWQGESHTGVWSHFVSGAVERRSMFNLLLWAPLVTHNPNLQVVIMHASHVCALYSLHVFELLLRMKECTERNLITHVWTFCHS